MVSPKTALLKTFFDDVTYEKHGFVVRKQRTETLSDPDACAAKVLEMIPDAIITDSYLHGGFITVEFF